MVDFSFSSRFKFMDLETKLRINYTHRFSLWTNTKSACPKRLINEIENFQGGYLP